MKQILFIYLEPEASGGSSLTDIRLNYIKNLSGENTLAFYRHGLICKFQTRLKSVGRA
jgi:hypothetical protein